MPRLPIATDRESLSEVGRRVYDDVMSDRGETIVGGRLPGPVAILMPYVPDIAGRISHVGTALRFEVSLPPNIIELATITTARGRDNAYVWAAHVPPALAAGVSDTTVEAVNKRAPLTSLGADETIVVRFARELIEDRKVSPEAFEAARRRFGDTGVMELTALIGYYSMMTCILTAVDMEPRPIPTPLLLP